MRYVHIINMIFMRSSEGLNIFCRVWMILKCIRVHTSKLYWIMRWDRIFWLLNRHIFDIILSLNIDRD